MAWKIEFSDTAERQLARLDRQIAARIVNYLTTRVAPLPNPRSAGQALTGSFGDLWRYRVGDYRVICAIEDEVLRVLIVRIGHRREVYRGS